jgi:hypothetical protein
MMVFKPSPDSESGSSTIGFLFFDLNLGVDV